MAQKKYYAVKKGRETGIFNTWTECKKQIDGYSGAIYKSFETIQDAKKFLDSEVKTKFINKENIKEVKAYVDGSYSQEHNKYSYGCVILNNSQVVELSGVDNNPNYVSMRNVSGELLGAMKAIIWAYENKFDSITIYYDYEGIERWANGSWKANKQGTQEYIEFIKRHRNSLDINFEKVKAHSGDLYNEEADRLAKEALFGKVDKIMKTTD